MPVIVAPAMDLDMYKHPATIANLDKISSFNKHYIIQAESGELASGLYGEGRMAEPDNIVNYIKETFSLILKEGSVHLEEGKALVTAGPTYEAIDPVRYTKQSFTGKMGFALAEVLAENGAEVILISGPSLQKEIHPNIRRVNITTAEEMYQASIRAYSDVDIAILSAVADYKPAIVHDLKLKKSKNMP